jgi:hypothetical protein
VTGAILEISVILEYNRIKFQITNSKIQMEKCLKRHLSFLVIIAIVFLLAENVSASNLTTLSDRMNRGAPSIGANHEIKFLTPSGVGDAGQFFEVTFASGFNLTAVTYNDIDLFYGHVTGMETEETINSIPNTTDWGVTILASSITFTHPTDDANGDILPNDFIVLRIGKNAAGGIHQIINPSTIGSKIISINGSFGDTGKLAVAIYHDQVGIVAGQQGGSPPLPAQPTLDPMICPIFKSPKTITGTTQGGTTVLINGLTDNIDYPSYGAWSYLASLNVGDNLFDIVARDSYGQNSSVLSVNIVRWKIGDTNGNFIVDDFDLAGLAHNWNISWCNADFNEDGIIDDFDLAGLASHWDSIY